MKTDDAVKLLVDKFVQVASFQNELYILSGALRTAVLRNEIPPESVGLLNQMIDYLSKQAANLEPFVKEMMNCPKVDKDVPAVNTLVVDPKAN